MNQHNVKVGKLERCQITMSTNLFEAIDLGFQPPCGTLLTQETLRDPETYYPLRLMVCPTSGLGQLDYVVGSDICFPKNYPYRPGISVPLREHLDVLAKDVVLKNKIKPGSLIVDIGSNDGTLLSCFKKLDMKVLGVEPTNMAQVANSDGIETVQAFFNKEVAQEIVEKYGRASVITFTNVFAHMASLGDVMEGVRVLLHADGVVVSESQYLLDVFEGNQFDEIYHDHIRIYSLKSLVKLFPYYGLEVFDAKRVATREGSIEVTAGWMRQHPLTPEVNRLLQVEKDVGLFTPEGWNKFRERVAIQKGKFKAEYESCMSEGKTMVADSCPTRGVVLLNYYDLELPYVSQLPGTEKIGKFIPGTHTPIVSNEVILTDQPDYILILAWHYSDYIIKNWRAKGVKAKFIIPLPEFTII